MAKGKVGLGRRGETLAADVLQKYGFTLIERNWHTREGEADLIATRRGEWYFIEVRTRRGSRYGSPEESLTPRKCTRMEAVARRYLSTEVSALDVTWHLSLMAVVMDRAGRLQRMTFYADLYGEPWEVPLHKI